MSGFVSPPTHFKKFRCCHCGEIYVEKVMGSVSPIGMILDMKKGIETKGKCDNCKSLKEKLFSGNPLDILKF